MELDHLAITCASLEEGAAWTESRLGVPLEPGGKHAHFGTHNRLPDRGVRLLALEVGHPRAPRLRELLATLHDPRVTVVTSDTPTLRARLSTPGGEVSL